MNRNIILLAAALTSFCSYAAENVLWKEDGSDLKVMEKYTSKAWFGKNLKVTAVPGKGVKFASSSTHLVPEWKQPVWFVGEVTGSEIPIEGKYAGWTVEVGKVPLAGNVRKANPGLYTAKLNPVKRSVMIVRLYNQKVTFKELKFVDKPENFIEIILPQGNQLKKGDKIKIILTLQKPCEDVTCQLFTDMGRGLVPLDLNGSNSVNLKPEDKSDCVWSGEITFQRTSQAKATDIIVKTVVLGGEIKIPIYGRSKIKF